MKRFRRSLLAISLCGLCQCAHQEVALEDPTLTPEYKPPPLLVATVPDDEAELQRRAEAKRAERNEGIASFIFDGLVSTASAAIFGTDKERREKRWKKSRKRKILVKKGYLDKDDGPLPEGYPSQF